MQTLLSIHAIVVRALVGDMKSLCLILFTLCVVVQAEELYTSKWDNINVDEILQSDRLLQNYNKCLLDQGPCTPDGAELKKSLSDALVTDCTKCTEKQKENIEKVVNFLLEQKKEMYDELEKKYDPTQLYRKKHMQN